MRTRGLENHVDRAKGFTLIELLIVVTVIGILATIAIPAFMYARYRALSAKIGAEERILENAVVEFSGDFNRFPNDTLPGEHPAVSTPQFAEYLSQNAIKFDQTYFQYDWENWSGISPNPDHLSTGVKIGLSVVPKGEQNELVQSILRMYGNKVKLTLSNHYTFPIEVAGTP